MKRILPLVCLVAILSASSLQAQEAVGDPAVEQVYVVFKTHLDIGYTDPGSRVEQHYIDNFIPKAIAVANELRESGGEERYVWTTGSWLIWAYLRQAPPEKVQELEEAIRRGDIAWNGMPYTVESEALNGEFFSGILELSSWLDQRYGKQTTGAKMTDVPGHTRSIVPRMSAAGIRFLHIGVNGATPMPVVPEICRWQEKSGEELILMYHKGYGKTSVLPDGKTAVSIAMTGDNMGPHTIGHVRGIYATLRKEYPNARIQAATLNDIANCLDGMRDLLPVLASEIGDTWIHGMGTSPVRMARFKALQRLYSGWIADNRLDPKSEEAICFAVRLGMVAEHTWGLDVKTHVKHWDIYEYDRFQASRNLPEFQAIEASWMEQDEIIEQSLEFLPADLRTEAERELSAMPIPSRQHIKGKRVPKEITPEGAFLLNSGDVKMTAGALSYQTFSAEDYKRFHRDYLTSTSDWAIRDFGKPGLENTAAQSALIEPTILNCDIRTREGQKEIASRLAFSKDDRVDPRFYPEEIYANYTLHPSGRRLDIELTLLNKPANRLPEAYWFSFMPEQVVSMLVEKTGAPVNVLDVVEGGNQGMHGVDRYVDIVTTGGKIRIHSPDALLVAVGGRHLLDYPTGIPDLRGGVHFCLFNNAWGTNFTMWFEGSVTYRFTIEIDTI